MNDLKILLISSAVPRDTTAGEVILYRHFSQSKLKLAIATDDLDGILAENLLEIRANLILNRLTQTRLSMWIHDIYQCFHPLFHYKTLRNYVKNYQPDIIITVAEGIHWIAAQKMSQEFNLPLATIFHDWWPDLASIHAWAKKSLERRFKQLYQQSAIAFCVSEEMQQLLGNHPNVQILYPIPDQLNIAEQPIIFSPEKPFKLVYAGSLSGIYAPMLQALYAALQDVQEVQLKLFGRPPNWSESLLQQLNEQGIYRGLVSRDLLRHELKTSSALLVTISFDPKNRRWAETSFPSKLVEYSQYTKPVVIWGPEYCSAVRWARKYQSALVVTSSLAQDLVKAIQELATQPEEQTHLANKALGIAQGMFNPVKIQQQFVDGLYQASKGYK